MPTDKPAQTMIHTISTVPKRIIRYILGVVVRIFGTTDDEYPKTGVQLFEGEFSVRSKLC